jgi:signal transduction histidine kinase
MDARTDNAAVPTVAAMVAGLAHDLRNRTNVLLSGLRLMVDQDDVDPLGAEVLDQARGLAVLLDRAIELATLEAGTAPTVEPIHLAELAELGARRARREWGASADAVVHGPLPGEAATSIRHAERVIADAIAACMLDGRSAAVELASDGGLVVRPDATARSAPAIRRGEREALSTITDQLAARCDVRLECSRPGMVLHFRSVEAG